MGVLRWCWMPLGNAALMLQEAIESTRQKMTADGILGNGAALYCPERLSLAIPIPPRQALCGPIPDARGRSGAQTVFHPGKLRTRRQYVQASSCHPGWR